MCLRKNFPADMIHLSGLGKDGMQDRILSQRISCLKILPEMLI